MAGETGDPASAGIAPESHQQNAQENPQAKDQKPAKPDQQAKAGDAPAGGEKKLSNAELKKKAKEEKAARRAQAKAAQVAQLGSAGQQSQAGEAKSGGGGGGKGKSKQDALQHHQKPGQRVVPVAAKEVKPAIPERFSHLPVARRIKTTQADKDVHPSVLIVGQYMATFEMINPTERLETTLLAFKKVISPQILSSHTVELTEVETRSLKAIPPHKEPPSPATSPPTSSAPRSCTSRPVAPCASPWATPSAG
jgi:translation initiation factor eIF-2B subunit delta